MTRDITLGMIPYVWRFVIIGLPLMYIGYRATGRNLGGALITMLMVLSLAAGMRSGTVQHKTRVAEWTLGTGVVLMLIVDYTGSRRQRTAFWTGKKKHGGRG